MPTLSQESDWLLQVFWSSRGKQQEAVNLMSTCSRVKDADVMCARDLMLRVHLSILILRTWSSVSLAVYFRVVELSAVCLELISVCLRECDWLMEADTDP
ncbi:hypothetical protein LDENG_00038930 [Lucifuga dentata]|nr:hypothetical protein LDENG_00038930 [Lucifuga dentata]